MSTELTYKKAKVWNRHTEDFSQIVKGAKVHIPAGKCIQVSRRQALDIRGHYPGKGTKTKIEIEPIFETIEVHEQYVDHKTGQVFVSQEAYNKHMGIDTTLASKPKGNECVICGDVFQTKDELVAHLGNCVKKHAAKEPEAAAKK